MRSPTFVHSVSSCHFALLYHISFSSPSLSPDPSTGRAVQLGAWPRPGWALPCVTRRGGGEVGRLWWAALPGMGTVQGWAVRSLFRLAVSRGVKAHRLWGLFQMHTLPREILRNLNRIAWELIKADCQLAHTPPTSRFYRSGDEIGICNSHSSQAIHVPPGHRSLLEDHYFAMISVFLISNK